MLVLLLAGVVVVAFVVLVALVLVAVVSAYAALVSLAIKQRGRKCCVDTTETVEVVRPLHAYICIPLFKEEPSLTALDTWLF